MLLQVSLHDHGVTIIGADVTVEAAVPGEGRGNYLTTVGDDCEAHEPRLPQKCSTGEAGLSAVAVPSAGGAAIPAATQPGAAAGDPKTGRYALSAYHFERCHKEGLDRNNLPGMKLFDDGTHGDLVADDGTYSLSFTDTGLEGSYNFRFFALGSTTDGIQFGRMRVSSQYVGIEPDPASTATTVQPGPIIGGLASQLFYFLPKDALGNYMGPGFSHKFKASVTGGQLYGEIIDMQNGYYVQVVRYPQGGRAPEVTITTADGCVLVGTGGRPGHCPVLGDKHALWLWILHIAIILLLLLLFLRCWKRRRAGY
jgi:hypothetical protein